MCEHLSTRSTRAAFGWVALILLCSALWAAAAAQPVRYLPGEDYQPIDNPVEYPGDKIPVIEFFLYSCPHCYAFDPAVSEWQSNLPEDVAFRRVPVLFGAGGRFYARMFYTAKALGVLDRLHEKIFDAIHQQGKRLTSMKAARAFFEAHGVDGERFAKVFNSPAIDKKIARAAHLMRAFGVRAVPSLGVAGRYWITGRMAGNNKAMLEVAEYLVQRARGEQSSGSGGG